MRFESKLKSSLESMFKTKKPFIWKKEKEAFVCSENISKSSPRILPVNEMGV